MSIKSVNDVKQQIGKKQLQIVDRTTGNKIPTSFKIEVDQEQGMNRVRIGSPHKSEIYLTGRAYQPDHPENHRVNEQMNGREIAEYIKNNLHNAGVYKGDIFGSRSQVENPENTSIPQTYIPSSGEARNIASAAVSIDEEYGKNWNI